MKLTKNKANSLLAGLKSGLSITLAIILLVSAFQPIQVRAAASESVAALFEIGPATTQENLETGSIITVQDVLLKVCLERGYRQECAQHLLGMLWKESNNIATAVGDHGKARGYFQIWVKLHKISVDCAEDLECSANWTLSYMERNSYPRYAAYAIQCHNGCNIDNGYAASAIRHGKRLWNSPLALVKTNELAIAR